ncbi:MAG: energy-coupling factor transporter transmembrane protein EcfT [Lachnospiraceae bacterium]|nr:energy-coupling factor transporter transmembrane protein EcfT [Lachnospiraceae bacterium]
MTRMISYEARDTWIHRLTGFTKLMFFIIWCIVSALTFDTRVLVTMVAISAVIFAMSRTEWKQISAVFKLLMLFMTLNLFFIFIFAPYQGCEIYGTRTDILHLFGDVYLTKEQLFYEFNVLLKYLNIAPAIFVFLVTTDPSEFAASLNKAGVPYTFAYSFAIALRYIPDVQYDFTRIRNAQEARGIEMSSKASLPARIKNVAAIIFPLLFSTMDRIDVVSNAMELRGFGKKNKRTWYSYRRPGKSDAAVMIFAVLFAVAALVLTYYDGSRFLF